MFIPSHQISISILHISTLSIHPSIHPSVYPSVFPLFLALFHPSILSSLLHGQRYSNLPRLDMVQRYVMGGWGEGTRPDGFLAEREREKSLERPTDPLRGRVCWEAGGSGVIGWIRDVCLNSLVSHFMCGLSPKAKVWQTREYGAAKVWERKRPTTNCINTKIANCISLTTQQQ
jgi:hypothetical protein